MSWDMGLLESIFLLEHVNISNFLLNNGIVHCLSNKMIILTVTQVLGTGNLVTPILDMQLDSGLTIPWRVN